MRTRSQVRLSSREVIDKIILALACFGTGNIISYPFGRGQVWDATDWMAARPDLALNNP